MFKKLLEELKNFWQAIITSRMFVLGVFLVALFAILIQRIFVLQIVKGQNF